MSCVLFSHRKRNAVMLPAFCAMLLAPTVVAAQASITFQPPGTFVFGVSADNSALYGTQDNFSFIEKNGNRTLLSMGGPFSFPAGTTADGATVVGTEYDNNFVPHAWVWHVGDAQPTELLPGIPCTCFGINPDGSLITGSRQIPNSFDVEAFAVRNGVFHPLTFPGAVSTFSQGFSHDGSLITGEVYRFTQNGLVNDAVVWHADDSATLIPMPPNTRTSRGIAVSPDGSTVAGIRETSGPPFPSPTLAWIWKVGDPSVSVINLGGGNTDVSIGSVSFDGSTVVGRGEIALNVSRGWVWRNGVLSVLAPPTGITSVSAIIVSADGYRIVGKAFGFVPPQTAQQELIVWDGDKPGQLLRDMLAALGAPVGSPELQETFGMSSDGTTIVGFFYNPPDAQSGSFVAILPLPPEKQLADLIDDVQGLGLEHGITNALLSKLNDAATAYANGDNASAITKLNDFINLVSAQSGKKIPTPTANELIAAAMAILVLL